jgi:PPK2 family polyphosphate:nucleotide phosphotransferase
VTAVTTRQITIAIEIVRSRTRSTFVTRPKARYVGGVTDRATDGMVATCRVGSTLRLADHDPRETFGWAKATAEIELSEQLVALSELQTRLFAAKREALLVVLQAMDAGGKDGVLRTVFTGFNPAGLQVSSFGVPTEEEQSHDYLWRVHQQCPAKGAIGIFNRSHYEDVVVVRAKALVPAATWERRYGHIVEFERMLTDEGTHIVKLFLNVSKEKQRERLQDRIDSPHERWKFRRGDLDDRALWDDYMKAYTDALAKTSTDPAPWYVVPADRKWVRNLVVARILRDALERIAPQYPEPEDDVEGLVVV